VCRMDAKASVVETSPQGQGGQTAPDMDMDTDVESDATPSPGVQSPVGGPIAQQLQQITEDDLKLEEGVAPEAERRSSHFERPSDDEIIKIRQLLGRLQKEVCLNQGVDASSINS